MQPSTTFPSSLGPLANVSLKCALSLKASLACPRQGRLHANGRLLSLRIIARQRALRLTCIFCLWLNYSSPHEGCNMPPDRPTRKRNASTATSCVRRASSSSNDSNPTYQDAAGATMTLTWLLLGFHYRVLRGHSSLTFFRTREGNGRQRVACLVTRPLGENLFRSGGSCERGLEHYARRLYGPSNFLGALHRLSRATFGTMTNPPSYDDDNELNFYLLTI
jgi:hypothetical protein